MCFVKWVGVGWGFIILILLFFVGDIVLIIIEVINKIGLVFYGLVLVMFLLGIYSKCIIVKVVNIGLLLGVFSNIFLWFSDNLLFWFWWNFIGFVVVILFVYFVNRFILSSNKLKL